MGLAQGEVALSGFLSPPPNADVVASVTKVTSTVSTVSVCATFQLAFDAYPGTESCFAFLKLSSCSSREDAAQSFEPGLLLALWRSTSASQAPVTAYSAAAAVHTAPKVAHFASSGIQVGALRTTAAASARWVARATPPSGRCSVRPTSKKEMNGLFIYHLSLTSKRAAVVCASTKRAASCSTMAGIPTTGCDTNTLRVRLYTPNPNPDPNPKSSSSTLHGRHSEDHQNVLPPSPPAWPELVSVSSSSDERCNSSAEAVVATAEAMMEEAEAKAEAEVKCCRTTFKC